MGGADATMDAAAAHVAEDQVLFELHCWSYFGLLKMGLLCAVHINRAPRWPPSPVRHRFATNLPPPPLQVLMDTTPSAGKRAVMKKRGPVLLHPGFLAAARMVIVTAAADPASREEVSHRARPCPPLCLRRDPGVPR